LRVQRRPFAEISRIPVLLLKSAGTLFHSSGLPDRDPTIQFTARCVATPNLQFADSRTRRRRILKPLHYLALLERKIGALDQAAPLAGWALPEEFTTLRRLLEARLGKPGKREFVQILRLMEVFRPDDALAGVREALARGFVGFDAVKHLSGSRRTWRGLDLKDRLLRRPPIPRRALICLMAFAAFPKLRRQKQ
jgi:hypothetical protein